jgi:hypothetical protein
MPDTATTTQIGARSPWLIAGTVVAVGTVLGIASEMAGELPRPWYLAAQLGAPWLVASFFVGRMCRRRGTGALAGVAVVGVGLLAVAGHRWLDNGTQYRALADLSMWFVLTIVAGSVSGAAGAVSRDARPNVRASAWALPVAIALLESALAYVLWSSVGVAVVDLALAAVVFAIGARRSSPGRLAAATAVGVATLIGLLFVARSVPGGSWGGEILG